METFTVLNDTPFIGYINNFLSIEECNTLIELGKIKPVLSEIYTDNGLAVDPEIRDSTTTYFGDLESKDNNVQNTIDLIYDRVSATIGIDKSHFEEFQITSYSKNSHFDVHYDFFIAKDHNVGYTEKIKKVLSKGGGNRIGTVLLYLNEPDSGGETYFSWTKIAIKPEPGKLLYFKYNYDDPMDNIKTIHQSIPVESGIKWIITILIAEAPLDQPMPNFSRYAEEGKIFTTLHDTCYELECGPDYDRRTLTISLPANQDPKNTLVVGFTGGMDSSLLLFLLGMLNTHQIIPYIILPVAIDAFPASVREIPEGQFGLGEDYRVMALMVKLIQSRLKNKGGILDFTYDQENTNPEFYHVCPSNVPTKKKAFFGLLDYFNNRESRFRKHTCLFMGIIEPPGVECLGSNNSSVSNLGIIKSPLSNLKKYHIVDALLQLNLEDILKLTPGQPPDIHSHTNLTEKCNINPCMERRWAFTKLIGLEQMGMDYFVNKYIWDSNTPEIEPINRYEDEVLKKNNLIR
jgi:prolyl 4-hydroxylase